MSSGAGSSVLSTLESDNNHKTSQDRKGLKAPIFHLGGGSAKPVYDAIACTPLTMETAETPVC
eukprot:2421014-Ditylum_brightwellii.AAC.2